MRISNNQIAKGSVVFANFVDSGETKDYLNGRPLIVVSNPLPLYNSVIVCTTGTRGRPGIQISLWNHHKEKYIGGADVSTIYPHNLVTIRVDQIYNTMGIIDPYIMKKVDSAVGFFLGLNEEVPEYLKEYEEILFGVKYSTASYNVLTASQTVPRDFQRYHSEKFIKTPNIPELENELIREEPQLVADEGKQLIPENLQAAWGWDGAEINKIELSPETAPEQTEPETPQVEVEPPQATTPVQEALTVVEEPVIQDPKIKLRKDIFNFIDRFCDIEPETTTRIKNFRDTFMKIADREGYVKDGSLISFGFAIKAYVADRKIDNVVEKVKCPTGTYYRGMHINYGRVKIEEIEPRQESSENSDSPPFTLDMITDPVVRNWVKIEPTPIQFPLPDSDEDLLKLIGKGNASFIVSRYAPIEAVCMKYNLKLYDAIEIRRRLMDLVISRANEAMVTINKIPTTFHNYDSFTKLGIALLIESANGVVPSRIRVKISESLVKIRKKYNLDLSDKKVWGEGIIPQPVYTE